MSEIPNFGFGKFVPGFDFLQNLAQGAAQKIPQMPNVGNWIAPTINVEELDKRIDELKAVQFWLDQNATALKATIQALEVQKMTLATLKGMNFNLGDVANAFKLKAADTVFSGVQKVSETTANVADEVASAGEAARSAERPAPAAKKPKAKAAAAGGVIDPVQWWGSLTDQFQQIAATAMKEAATKTAMDTTRNVAMGVAKGALKAAGDMAKAGRQAATGASTGRKSPAAPKKRVAAKRTTRRVASR